MTIRPDDVRFAVKALPAASGRPNEFTRTMAPHPLVYQELPYDPEFLLYNHRLIAMHLSNSTPDEAYWRVRRQVILRHTGELPLEVRGSDAARMLDHVFTRDISGMKVDRCSYQFACYDDGGMITEWRADAPRAGSVLVRTGRWRSLLLAEGERARRRCRGHRPGRMD